MTNELEKQFCDTFGIEPKHIFRGCRLGAKYYAEICDETTCNGCDEEIRKTEYPQITDRILLELICMANQHEEYPISTSIKNIQARTLRILLRTEKFYRNFYENDKRYKKFKHQVRSLFEERQDGN